MFATIYLPNFYLQAALRYQEIPTRLPIALIDDQEKKAVIIQLNSAAEAAGIRKGMTPSQGLARSLHLVLKTRSRAQEKSIAEIVLHYAFTVSPYVEATAPGLTTIEFKTNRDLMTKIERIVENLAANAIIAQAGLAQTPDTSFLAAYLARPILQVEEAKRFLSTLPIDTLAIDLPYDTAGADLRSINSR